MCVCVCVTNWWLINSGWAVVAVGVAEDDDDDALDWLRKIRDEQIWRMEERC